MIHHCSFSLVLILASALGQHVRLAKENQSPNATDIYNKINTTDIISEGGTIVLDNPILNLSKESSFGVPKEKIKKTSSVVRKNGVKFTPEELAPLNATRLQLPADKQHLRSNLYPKNVSQLNEKSVVINEMLNTTKNTQSTPGTTNKPAVHKPLILSYEALSKMDVRNEISSLPLLKTSPNTMANQLPLPDDNNSLSSKIYSMNTGNPGMIMPIVITTLVVPVFAVLGYMAVKRGQEAWRNRHYKRMDFLLDGMYND